MGSGSPTVLANCLFYRNEAGDVGGAIHSSSDIELINCTVSQNKSAPENNGGAGLYCADGDSALKNSILWRNKAGGTYESEDDQIVVAGGTVAVTYSCIEQCDTDPGGWCYQTNNTDQSPKFQSMISDDYHLKTNGCPSSCNSSAIDEGLDDDICGVYDPDVDLDSQPRCVDIVPGDEKTDMGAYEVQSVD